MKLVFMMRLIDIQGPLFGCFQPFLVVPLLLGFSLPLHIQAITNLLTKRELNLSSPRFEPIPCSSSNQGATTQAIYVL